MNIPFDYTQDDDDDDDDDDDRMEPMLSGLHGM